MDGSSPHELVGDQQQVSCPLPPYELAIDQGTVQYTEQGEKLVVLPNGTQYRVVLTNRTKHRCDALLHIDGQLMFNMRINPETSPSFERPSHVNKKFTFYRADLAETAEACDPLDTLFVAESGAIVQTSPLKGSGIKQGNPELGVVEVKFTPEKLLTISILPEWSMDDPVIISVNKMDSLDKARRALWPALRKRGERCPPGVDLLQYLSFSNDDDNAKRGLRCCIQRRRNRLQPEVENFRHLNVRDDSKLIASLSLCKVLVHVDVEKTASSESFECPPAWTFDQLTQSLGRMPNLFPKAGRWVNKQSSVRLAILGIGDQPQPAPAQRELQDVISDMRKQKKLAHHVQPLELRVSLQLQTLEVVLPAADNQTEDVQVISVSVDCVSQTRASILSALANISPDWSKAFPVPKWVNAAAQVQFHWSDGSEVAPGLAAVAEHEDRRVFASVPLVEVSVSLEWSHKTIPLIVTQKATLADVKKALLATGECCNALTAAAEAKENVEVHIETIAPESESASAFAASLQPFVGPFVSVRTLVGKDIAIDGIGPTSTVAELKEAVRDKEGIPSDQQRLIFAGMQLADQQTLADYNITPGSTVHLVLRLRGGCFVGSTSVVMGDGSSKPISQINVGEEVSTLDVTSGLGKLPITAPVIATCRKQHGRFIEIHTKPTVSGIPQNAPITCTPDHTFYVVGKGWAAHTPCQGPTLEVGDHLISSEQAGASQVVTAIEELSNLDTSPVETYCLSVASTCSFFVGGVLAHNMQIFVKTLDGRTLPLDAQPSDTAHSLKLSCIDAFGLACELDVNGSGAAGRALAANDVSLIFAGKQLEDGRALQDYNIQGDSTLHLVIKKITNGGQLRAGGTTLQGESQENYGNAECLIMNEREAKTLRLCLVASADDEVPAVRQEECTALSSQDELADCADTASGGDTDVPENPSPGQDGENSSNDERRPLQGSEKDDGEWLTI
mmetsp:Transcript_122968/g.223488  ORF Transcript_122968/g.223488 Transcript_122968/m.223488 type:complete len:961 (+) Transcript_122968:47-2929(+)